MKIDYSKLFLDDYRKTVSDERKDAISIVAQNQRAYYDYKYRYLLDGTRYGIMASRAKEFVTINKDNAAKSLEEKILLVSDILFENGEFADYLNKGHFDFDTLSTYIRLLSHAQKYEEEVKKNPKVSKAISEYTTRLMTFFNRIYGRISPEFIINKINEVLVYNPELVERKETSRSR